MEVIKTMLQAKKSYLKAIYSFEKNARDSAREVYLASLDELSLEQLNDFYPVDNPIMEHLKLEEATLLLDSYNDSEVSSYLIKRGVDLFKPFDQVAFLSFILFLAPNDFHAQELRKTFHSIFKTHAELFFYSVDNLPQNLEVFSQSEYKELGYLLIVDAIKNGANTLEFLNAIYQNKKLVSYLEQDTLFDIFFSYNKAAFQRELALLDFIQNTKPEGFGEKYLLKTFEHNKANDNCSLGFLYHEYKDNYFNAQDFYQVCQKNPAFLTLFTNPIQSLLQDNLAKDDFNSVFKSMIAVMISDMEKQVGKFTSIDFEKLAFHVLDNAQDMNNKELAQKILSNVQKDNNFSKKNLKL